MSRIQTQLRQHKRRLLEAFADADPDDIRHPCRHCRDVLLPPGETHCESCLEGMAEDAEEAQAEAVRERRRLGED
jgi:cytidine deaminase